ncbi:hypothetical protein LUZ63_014463 [Rhynchospora breviuscula]|uniref:Inositol polyphosphate-related phosphatase domain-containing protein n=1 Tax=Rhynchospora breviuscula TaxID=2022672 RepID=A0A9Q0CAJ4_9POAL|nr:hypothetical protein LUZ63_014463 [Rhynchospora breviuscula]
MKTERPNIPKSSSWPKNLVKKWFNMNNAEFHSDFSKEMLGGEERRKSCSDKDGSFVRRDLSGGWLIESTENLKPQNYDDISPPTSYNPPKSLRIFVGTWNVGGRAPHEGLNLGDWLLNTPSPADVYVLGFQEIVPLNAGNVLGAEKKGPANKWLHLIRQTLNASSSSNTPHITPNNTNANDKPRISFSELLAMESEIEPVRWSTSTNSSITSSSSSGEEELGGSACQGGKYVLVASKQMVGVFLCVWLREELMRHITSVKVSCVGRGIMGYMGNKGSISISMTIQRTTFCFVCTHLASGEKDGDEIRRNSDVVEILKKTKFLQSRRFSRTAALSPETILDHDKIIWLGDLNYRLVSSSTVANELLEKNNWQALLEKDQLRIEQRAGRIFAGWQEGSIYFPPTYKYIEDSDIYAVNSCKSKEKRRTPAWCDRILWQGNGMNQIWYGRGESQFSDHRPVYSLFLVELDDHDTYCHKPTTNPAQVIMSDSKNYSNSTNASSNKVQLVARTQSCLQTSRF